MKNKIFQFIWSIVKALIKKRPFNQRDFFDSYGPMFVAQDKLARIFDKNYLALLGDSEIEGMADREYMASFDMVVANYGKGGSKPYHIIQFLLQNKYGKKLYKSLKNRMVIISNGGNSMWANETLNIKEELSVIRHLLPLSIMVTLPPVHADWLDALDDGTIYDKTAEEYNNMVDEINGYIWDLWGIWVIDINTILTNPEEQKAFWFALKDPVHYSDFSEMVFRKLGEAIIKFIRKVRK